MTLVFIGLYMLKFLISRHRRSVHDRGAYEVFFSELQQANADMWSRTGPRESNINPIGLRSKLKWFLLKRWTNSKTSYNAASLEDHTSNWTIFKKFLIRRWTTDNQLIYATQDSNTSSAAELIEEGTIGDEKPPVGSTISSAPDVEVARSRWKRRHMHSLDTQAARKFADEAMRKRNLNTANESSGAIPWGATNGYWGRVHRNGTINSVTPPSMYESPPDDEPVGAAVMDRIPSTIKEGEIKETRRAPSSIPLRENTNERLEDLQLPHGYIMTEDEPYFETKTRSKTV